MPVIILLFLTLLSGLALSSPLASADDTVVDEIEITVPISCNLTGVGMNTHTTSLMNGNYATDVGTTTIKAFCNDNEGFAIYAIGYTDDTDGKNVMSSSTLSSDHDIPTGLLTSGSNSQWAMKLATQTNPEPTYPISIQNNYNAYHTVPDDYDLVAKRTASTDSGTNAIGSTLTSTYQIYASPTQPAGTYIGQVKYVMVHPHDADAPRVPLYNLIAAMSKGTQTASDLQSTISASNSGVFTYDSVAFGTSSDDDNNYAIYYYRGILDSDLDGTSSSYGSNGDGETWPNYVLLDANNNGTDISDTCWRIVRTTGSGGIKMIYNGLYGATNLESCANSAASAALSDNLSYNGTSSTNQRLALVGYTYNPTYGDNNVQNSTSVNTILGSNANYSNNNANSNIKNYIDLWFSNNLASYENLLENSAGYCSDRTTYSNESGSLTISYVAPYATSNAKVYFGAYSRNLDAAKTPSLTCPSDRNIVDLYTTNSADDGNKQLNYPIALLTADEASFAGSGASQGINGSAYHFNSFLRTGTNFWLLSPSNRLSSGYTSVGQIRDNGYLYYGWVSNNNSNVRPVISLIHEVFPSSGQGTATDPWIINAP